MYLNLPLIIPKMIITMNELKYVCNFIDNLNFYFI